MPMTYKELITKLQMLPRVIVPVAVYPSKWGTYAGSRYYAIAQDEEKLASLVSVYPLLCSQLKDLVIEGRLSQDVQKLSNDICKGIVTPYGKAKAIHDWVFTHIDYTPTTYPVPPAKLIKTRAGDCKSYTALIAALLGIQKIPCWFKLVQLSDKYCRHIYNYALVNSTWYPVDGTGYFCFREVKRVIGYLLFEVDKTTSTPPQPLPSPVGAEEVPPIIAFEELEEAFPLVCLAGLVLLGLKKDSGKAEEL